MMRTKTLSVFFLLLLHSSIMQAYGCAVCFGAPDDPMTKGMQWGIATLLLILLPVLSTFGGFFFFLYKRAKSFAPFRDPALFQD